MKTAIELLKFVSIMLLLAWLCSCSNRKQKIIETIKQYNDSVGIANINLRLMDYELQEITDKYEDAYQPQRFDLSNEGERQRKEWLKQERAGYTAMLEAKRMHERDAYPKRIELITKIGEYKQVIDSLKLELYN